MADPETEAREKKAKAIAAFMLKEMIRVAETADEDLWLATAAKAGQRKPSDLTRERVIELLRLKIFNKAE